MLKQKLIPILGVTVLLFGCGSNSTTIEINNHGPEGMEGFMLVSKDFDAKEGQKFTFTVNHGDLLEDDFDPGSVLIFAEAPFDDLDNPIFIDFINKKESINITYNNEKMDEFKEGDEKFIEYFNNNEFDKIDGTFIFSSMEIVKEDPQPVLVLCHKNKTATDKITYTLTSAVNKSAAAIYLNAFDL